MKFPRDLLDVRADVDREGVERFLANAHGLGRKLGPILVQFPPWVKPDNATRFLGTLFDCLDPSVRYAVEVRSKEWFEGSSWSWLNGQLVSRRIALTWSYLTYLDVPAERTTDFVYLRFIGDHTTVPEGLHGEIRVNRDAVIDRWARRVRAALETGSTGFTFFNNHFQGFSPELINLFRRANDLPPVVFAPSSLDFWDRPGVSSSSSGSP